MNINIKQSQGFSLVELMVAMVIGLIVVGGAFSMHSTSRSTQHVTEVQMDMAADARFAIELIAYDLRQAGSWGGTNKDSLIDCRTADTACPTVPAAVTGDCATGWAYDLSSPIFASDGSNPHGGSSCIGDGEKYVAATDVLEIRYADANPPTLRAGQAYVRSNFTSGRIFVGATEPVLDGYNASPLTKNHELHAYAYYVSSFTDSDPDGIPSLRRVALVPGAGAPKLEPQLLVSGVADFQVQFGIDTIGNDQIIDRYVNAGAVADWQKVYAAKIWLLMRSDKVQKPGVGKEKTFSMAGVDKTVGGPGDYRYFMVSSVVDLRNMKQQ